MMVAVSGLITLQSCKKEAAVKPTVYVAAMPDSPSPAVDAVVAFTGTGQTINLTWAGTATNAIKWNVYFGTTASPDLVASNVTTNSYTATVTEGGTYYWAVSTIDANKVESDSPVWSFEVNSNPNVPATPAPANNAANVSATLASLTWTATDPENDDLTYDVYLGTTSAPAPVATGLTSASYTLPSLLSPTTVYYWKIVAHDPYGGQSTSPVWQFTTGALPVNSFVGNYTADEPAEAYNYPVSFTMVSSTSVKTTNYWNSGWSATFTLDFTKKIYTMPFTQFTTSGQIWTGIESGSIDPATGKMQGTYTIWEDGVISEQGVHTYTHL